MAALSSKSQTLREAVKTLLTANVAALASRVSTNQWAPVDLEDLPFVSISTPSVQRTRDNADGMETEVELQINIFAGEDADNSVEDSLNHYGDAIEAVMLAAGRTLGGAVWEVRPGPQVVSVDDDAENIYGVQVDTYFLKVIFDNPAAL